MHLASPATAAAAATLGVDARAAMVGFNVARGGRSVPLYEGRVVLTAAATALADGASKGCDHSAAAEIAAAAAAAACGRG